MPGQPQTLILGIGNLIFGDDGLGVRAVERIQARPDLPPYVQAVDGGTCGLDLIARLEGVERLVLVDAVKTGAPPGSLVRLEGEQIPQALSGQLSAHQAGLPDLLEAARLCGVCPPEVILVGITPANLECSLDLSAPVASRMDELVDLIIQIVCEVPANTL